MRRVLHEDGSAGVGYDAAFYLNGRLGVPHPRGDGDGGLFLYYWATFTVSRSPLTSHGSQGTPKAPYSSA